MAADPNEMYITVMIADLYCQPRPIVINPFTTVDNVRYQFGYGPWICLYVSADGRRIDGKLWAYRLRDQQSLDFRMLYRGMLFGVTVSHDFFCVSIRRYGPPGSHSVGSVATTFGLKHGCREDLIVGVMPLLS
jgi:hypothetical protein